MTYLGPSATYEEAYPEGQVPEEWRSGAHQDGPVRRVDEAWPKLDPAALYGLAGEVVTTLDPHTEADPALVLVSFLTAFGAMAGPGPHAVADGAEHPGRLFAVGVGETSRSRKGTAMANVRRVLHAADPYFTTEQVLGGLASGEGVIAAVSDSTEDADDEDAKVVDKRVLVFEPEWVRPLKVSSRDGSTLSAVLRDAWDRGDLRVMTRKDPLRASGAHVCLLGHVTFEELRRHLTETEIANGFGNRHLFVAARRSKRLPSGGNLDDLEVHALGQRVREVLRESCRVGILRRSPQADVLWEEIYNAIPDDVDGLVGSLTARAEAQMLRLSVIYALLDGAHTIHVQHLQAAEAMWRYCQQTVIHVFGDSTGDEVADKLLAAIRKAGAEGITFTGQRDLFGRHMNVKRLAAARQLLEDADHIITVKRPTAGRPVGVSFASEHATEASKATEGPEVIYR